MNEVCNDNRFELIEKYKQKLIETTNIETSAEEMKTIDNILFRFWQMGWLDKLEQPEPCSDAVSRRLAIDATLGVIPYDEYWEDQIIDAINRLPSAQPEPQWIPCSECVNYIDERCVVANHHVSEKENCMEVFGAKRRTV